MTEAEIDLVPAGRQLDRLVGEHVMGCKVVDDNWGLYKLVMPHLTYDSFSTEDGAWAGLPPYSTDINTAWTVLEKLRGTDGVAGITVKGEGVEVDNDHIFQSAPTLPLAICRLALKWHHRKK